MKQNRTCEICGNETELSVIKEIKYKLPSSYKIPSWYEIVSCKKCGFCYANVLASISDYDHYYKNYNYYSQEVLSNVPANLSKNEVMDLFCRMCRTEDKILDIGFGKGELLLTLRSHGFLNLFGLDPSGESVGSIKEHGIRAQVGNIYQMDHFTGEKMDVVVIAGVLEHLLEPSLALENITKVLAIGGKLIVTVPNCLNLKKDISPVCSHFNQEHINYFSVVSLKNMMARYGFLEELVIAEEKYTDILAVFRYHGEHASRGYEKDEQTSIAIGVYLESNGRREELYNRKLEKYVREQLPVAVWGTGAFAMSLLSNTDLGDCNIHCFIDNNEMKCSSDFLGKAVILPQYIANHIQIQAIVIASIRSAAAIKEQLLNLGWDRDIIVLSE